MKIKQIIVTGSILLLMLGFMTTLYNIDVTLYNAFFRLVGVGAFGSYCGRLCNFINHKIENEEK